MAIQKPTEWSESLPRRHGFALRVPGVTSHRTARSRSRTWASVCIGLSAVICAGSLTWMLTAPDGRRHAPHTDTPVQGVNQRLLIGGLGALVSVGIGIVGILCWPQGGRLRVRRADTSLSTYDSMTGLPTKRLFMVLLTQALTRAETTRRPVAVLVIELTQCRPVATGTKPNMTLVVRVQAARIKSVLHTHDAVARLDEGRFAVILDNLDSPEQILTMANTVQTTMALPLQVEGQEWLLSCRIAGAIAPYDGHDGDSLLERAIEILSSSQSDDAAIAFSSNPATLPPPADAGADVVGHRRAGAITADR